MATLSGLKAPDIRLAKRLVVKIGSALLVDRKLGLKQSWLSALALVFGHIDRGVGSSRGAARQIGRGEGRGFQRPGVDQAGYDPPQQESRRFRSGVSE